MSDSTQHLVCKACGAPLDPRPRERSVACPYCHTRNEFDAPQGSAAPSDALQERLDLVQERVRLTEQARAEEEALRSARKLEVVSVPRQRSGGATIQMIGFIMIVALGLAALFAGAEARLLCGVPGVAVGAALAIYGTIATRRERQQRLAYRAPVDEKYERELSELHRRTQQKQSEIESRSQSL